MRTLTAAFTLAAACFAADARAAGFKIVANPSVSEARLSADELSRIFLKRTLRWADGASIAPVDLISESPVRDAFSRTVLKMAPSLVVAHWQKQIFSGRSLPPPTKANAAAVIEFLQATPGSIGYVDEDVAVGGLKVIAIAK